MRTPKYSDYQDGSYSRNYSMRTPEYSDYKDDWEIEESISYSARQDKENEELNEQKMKDDLNRRMYENINLAGSADLPVNGPIIANGHVGAAPFPFEKIVEATMLPPNDLGPLKANVVYPGDYLSMLGQPPHFDIKSWDVPATGTGHHRKANKKMSDRDYESENRNLREALMQARDKLKEVDDFVANAKEGVLTFGYILKKINNNRAVIASDDGSAECPIANGINISVGAMVKLSDGVVVDNANINLPGEIYIVSAVDHEEVEVDMDGTPNRVIRSQAMKVEAGDRVVLDPSGQIIVRNLGKDQQKFSFTGNTGVSWNDIGGLEVAKNALREAIELPSIHSELFKKYGKSVSKGVLLHGPTGCGKTLLAKAAATSLAATFGAKAKDTGFIYVKGPELLDKWVGNTESMIRGLFARARDHKKAHGYPAILFIDEADSLLGARGGANGEHSHILSSTIVPQFLSEMDGLEDSGAFVLLATNRPDILDPAVVRDGRIDRKVYVGRPDAKGAADILAIHLRNRPVDNGQNRSELVQYAAEKIYADDHTLYEVSFAVKNGFGKNQTHMRLRDLVNGAMLAGIVENATSNALMRDIAKGTKKPSGIGQVDMDAAILRALEENRDTNHEGAIEDFADTLGGKVTEIRKANSKPPVSAAG